jgi:hypothetical protein
MIPAMIAKIVIKQVIKAITKMDDKELASNHEKRIKKLEDKAHAPRDFVTCDCCKKKLKEKK